MGFFDILMKTLRWVIVFGIMALSQTSWAQTTISVDEFEQKVKNRAGAQLLDVRTVGEYQNGHLLNALNVDFTQKDRFATDVAALDKNRPVLVYCLSGGRSAGAMDYLLKNGFKEVYNMAGGFLKWSGANKPFESANAVAANTYSKEAFDKLVQENALLMIDFYAEWCGPCKKMAPAIEKLKQEYVGKVKIMKIDTDANKELAQRFGIDEIPTVLFFKKGKLTWRGIGYTDEEHLRKEIEAQRK